MEENRRLFESLLSPGTEDVTDWQRANLVHKPVANPMAMRFQMEKPLSTYLGIQTTESLTTTVLVEQGCKYSHISRLPNLHDETRDTEIEGVVNSSAMHNTT